LFVSFLEPSFQQPEEMMNKDPYDGAEGRPPPYLVIADMPVTNRDGMHVGTVDKVEGGHLKFL